MQAFRQRQEPAVEKLKQPLFDEIASALVSRYGLNFTRQDTASLWFLCKQVIGFCGSYKYNLNVIVLLIVFSDFYLLLNYVLLALTFAGSNPIGYN